MNSNSKSENALITGASSGIGLEFAKIFAHDGANLILIARDQKGLEMVADSLRKEFSIKVETIALDLSSPDSAGLVYKKVSEIGWSIDYLINNAGFGDFTKFIESDWDKEKSMIELNITTLTHLCRLFIPDMVLRKKGRVLNIASTAAFIPGPFMAVYYATKSYVLSFSQAINNELRNTGVTVTVLCPGPTNTNFAKVSQADTSDLFKGKLPTAATVAQFGYAALMKGKTVAIQGFSNKIMIFFARFLPRNILTALSRKATGK